MNKRVRKSKVWGEDPISNYQSTLNPPENFNNSVVLAISDYAKGLGLNGEFYVNRFNELFPQNFSRKELLFNDSFLDIFAIVNSVFFRKDYKNAMV